MPSILRFFGIIFRGIAEGLGRAFFLILEGIGRMLARAFGFLAPIIIGGGVLWWMFKNKPALLEEILTFAIFIGIVWIIFQGIRSSAPKKNNRNRN